MKEINVKSNLLKIALAAMIAAMYTVTAVLLNFASYGVIQFRVSEILTILPVFTLVAPAAVAGLTLGCFLSNLVGLFIGANLAGIWDLLFGTMATFLAAILTYLLRNYKFKGLPILSVIPPIVINALVVGTELTVVLFSKSDSFNFVLLANILQVCFGQLVMCGVGGLILYNRLDKFKIIEKMNLK